MFSTKGQEAKGVSGTPKSFQAGVVYAQIHSANVKVSKGTGKKSLELVLEGPALPNFEGWSIDKNIPNEKFKGQSARVSATMWTADYNSEDINKNDILNKLIIISDEMGLRKEVDNVSSLYNINSIEEWVYHVVNILKGNYAYFFLKGTEEEYNGKTIIKLSLPKYKFCSSVEDKLEKFDKTNSYHYKSLDIKPVSGFEPGVDFQM